MTAEPWISVEAVAKHLDVAKDSVYRWIEHKALPAHRMGRLWKFKISEVDEWVRQGGAAPGPAAGRQDAGASGGGLAPTDLVVTSDD
ncbi:MAG: helix-turn-helix domain-containing protein [Deltaproteobacteria bacterium]|nr:helix-turn-helix domain-containing protein [Deltaproteobacteria bacterium]